MDCSFSHYTAQSDLISWRSWENVLVYVDPAPLFGVPLHGFSVLADHLPPLRVMLLTELKGKNRRSCCRVIS